MQEQGREHKEASGKVEFSKVVLHYRVLDGAEHQPNVLRVLCPKRHAAGVERKKGGRKREGVRQHAQAAQCSDKREGERNAKRIVSRRERHHQAHVTVQTVACNIRAVYKEENAQRNRQEERKVNHKGRQGAKR